MGVVVHKPVMAEQVLEIMRVVEPQGVIVDGTIGGGGHAELLLEASHPSIRLLALDRDLSAIEMAKRRLSRFGDRVSFWHGSCATLPAVLDEAGIGAANRVLLDLGTSRHQLLDPLRGMGFESACPLDMRFDQTESTQTADDVVHRYSAEKLQDIFSRYGEFRYSRGLAQAIVERRKRQKFESAAAFAEFVKEYCFRRGWKKHSLHPATQVFQALRMEVNRELEVLEACLRGALACLAVEDGVLGVIAFHSIEDRIVKQCFRAATQERDYHLLTKRPLAPTEAEVSGNPASRSAKFRAIKRGKRA